jgi:hypothetical protein
MHYSKDVVGYLSATETLKELENWWSDEELKILKEFDYRIVKYFANDYKYHNNHWLIKQDSSHIIEILK